MSNHPLLILVNKKAGHGLPDDFEHQIRSVMKQNTEYKIEYSDFQGHLKELAHEALENGVKTIVIAGGDGSVNEVSNPLIGKDVNLGIIPVGSGNGLARHLKIPLDIKKAIELIKNGNTKLIDAALINDQPFFSIAGTGFDALIAKHFSEIGSRGFLTYFKLVLKYYLAYQPLEYEIFHDGDFLQKKALLISFANSDQFGNNFSIAPRAIINDGFLDTCILQKPPIYALPFTLLKLIFKQINKSNYYHSFKTKHLQINSKNRLMINIDGEYQLAGKEIEVKIIPGAIKVYVP